MDFESPNRAPVVPRSSVQYRPAIDGLRAAAVLAVFVFHLKRQWLPGGFVGVDIFFVVSGFLITSILLREYERNTFSLWKFYQRRIARLFPAFFTVALATLLGASLIYSAQDLASCGANLVTTSLSVANLKYMWQGNYFAISPDAQPFLHYWSLSVEEQFYLLFPVVLLLLYLKANAYKTAILAVLCGASLIACIALTHRKPEWAFYLLPTRAWELLAGSILANLSLRPATVKDNMLLWTCASVVGMALIVFSLIATSEGPTFPGYHAILPVLGTVLVVGSSGASTWPARFLSTGPMVVIGRMSYSIYLWHWPIFSLVDYKLYLTSPMVRVVLKVAFSAAAATLCFFLIESPGRVFLNHPRRRRVTFAFLAVALVVSVLLGTAVRSTNYVDAGAHDIAQGGIVFNQNGTNGSMVLMGDSNGSMYGKMAREIARILSHKLDVISVAAGDPLPHSTGRNPQLWIDSLAFVRRENPDVLLLVCNWRSKLKGENARLEIAVSELKRHTRRLVLITQPPELPKSAEREAIRNGSRPPFTEDPSERAARTESNTFLKGLQRDNVIVVDIEPLFSGDDGSIRFADDHGKLLYHDGDHLSDVGADLVKTDVIRAIEDPRSQF